MLCDEAYLAGVYSTVISPMVLYFSAQMLDRKNRNQLVWLTLTFQKVSSETGVLASVRPSSWSYDSYLSYLISHDLGFDDDQTNALVRGDVDDDSVPRALRERRVEAERLLHAAVVAVAHDHDGAIVTVSGPNATHPAQAVRFT